MKLTQQELFSLVSTKIWFLDAEFWFGLLAVLALVCASWPERYTHSFEPPSIYAIMSNPPASLSVSSASAELSGIFSLSSILDHLLLVVSGRWFCLGVASRAVVVRD